MRKLLILIAAVAAVCVAVVSARGEEEEVNPRLESLRRLEARADSGCPDAIFRFARVLETGDEALPQDSARAFDLYRMAADSMYPPALNYIGYCYYTGNSVLPQRRDTAIMLIEKAAMLGDMSAAANLGWLLSREDAGVHRDLDKALHWLGRAAESGNPAPLASMAGIYMERGDSTKAEQYLDSAARLGDIPSSLRLISIREERYDSMQPQELMREALDYYHTTRALPLAVGIFSKLAEADSETVDKEIKAYATAIIAQLKSLGLGVAYDYEGAMRMFLEAARMGDPSAQYIVGETLDMTPDAFGDGVEDAGEWRCKAATVGIEDAHAALRRLLP